MIGNGQAIAVLPVFYGAVDKSEPLARFHKAKVHQLL